MLVQLLEPDPILRDDPVRPSISPERKLSYGRFVYMWIEGREIGAVVCFARKFRIPRTERELAKFNQHEDTDEKVILYSIWSYKKGCGQKLVRAVARKESQYRIITMSPKTAMARDFHIRNGATVLQINRTTINFEYKV
jgi:hypothetical protein